MGSMAYARVCQRQPQADQRHGANCICSFLGDGIWNCIYKAKSLANFKQRCTNECCAACMVRFWFVLALGNISCLQRLALLINSWHENEEFPDSYSPSSAPWPSRPQVRPGTLRTAATTIARRNPARWCSLRLCAGCRRCF